MHPLTLILVAMSFAFAQTGAKNSVAIASGSNLPPIEPGVSLELAKWRAARYSDVRYKLNLTLEKMSPVLKGTMEIRVNVSEPPASAGGEKADGSIPPIVLDWRKIKGHEEKSTISNVSINGKPVPTTPSAETAATPPKQGGEFQEHLIFSEGVVIGENVIKLDFTSPILTSGSAITRYVDKEDGSEYIYSLFVPSDASTAFPVFDQPDIKARFKAEITVPAGWRVVSNGFSNEPFASLLTVDSVRVPWDFAETKPISTYVFAFAAGPFEKITGGNPSGSEGAPQRVDQTQGTLPTGRVSASGGNRTGPIRTEDQKEDLGDDKRVYREWRKEDVVHFFPRSKPESSIYVRKSQAAKFKPHAAEVFRLNREAIRYFEEYFDYKFPWPKYDLVLIPEFPFGGMEHAGATFLRESSIIFPQEPTKNDHISRALLMFHEASHQWFGDTVTMRWFDDLWLKEGFATFTAYKAMEKIMPEMLAWKVFYERVKQAAYQTDSTRGTTAIYQPIANLSAAKSAYGNIVYNKAPAFLRQAEFYLGEDKFRTAVRAFLKKHEFGNAGWEDLVRELGFASNNNLSNWAATWVKQPGLPTYRLRFEDYRRSTNTTGRPGELKLVFTQSYRGDQPRSDRHTYGSRYEGPVWPEALQFYYVLADARTRTEKLILEKGDREIEEIWGYNVGGLESREAKKTLAPPRFVFTNYGDYGYGIFLLDDKSREYVLKNIQNEKDPFLRSMMWGALWDSVREGELDPREYVELVVKVLQKPAREQGLNTQDESKALANARASASEDESTTSLLLSRVGTAMNYYMDAEGRNPSGSEGAPNHSDRRRGTLPTGRVSAPADDRRTHLESVLLERMQNAETLGQRITYYRAFLNIASSENARTVLKGMLRNAGTPAGNARNSVKTDARKEDAGKGAGVPLRTKDKFDIVTRLLILNDPEAAGLLAQLEKTETGDDAKRYAYAARAGIPTAENKAKYWNDFVNNKEISESWIEAAFGPWNSIRHSELTQPYLERALKELPNHKRNRKIFFVNGWLGAFIGGQRSEEALAIVDKFLSDNPNLDYDLRLKILENVDVIERAVRIRQKHGN